MKLDILLLAPLFAILAGMAQAASAAPQTAPDRDIETIKARLVASVLPRDAKDVAALSRAAAEDFHAQKPDGTFGNVDYSGSRPSNWTVVDHLQNTLRMAKAYNLPGQPLYHDAAVRQGILKALSHWLEKDYPNSNWWWMQIGTPQLIGEAMILMNRELTPDLRVKGAALMDRAKLVHNQGENTVWMAANQMMRGLLLNDPDVVKAGYDYIYGELYVTTPGKEGIMPDWSFHQHGVQFYSGGYGYMFACDTARWTSLAWGTRYQIPEANRKVLDGYELDGEQWMVRGKIFDYSAVGREITRKGKVAVPDSWTVGPISPVGAAYGLLNAMDLLGRLPVPRQKEYAAFASRLRTGKPALVGHKHFWDSDYTSHSRAGYLATVKMFSTRIQNGEITNSEGRRSQHLSDGATLLYRTGDEYRDIFGLWDWLRVPGTTIELLPEPFDPKRVAVRNGSAFVGGVSNGLYGASAMHLVRDNLDAKKAWFFFDDEIVNLGAGITCASDDGVQTNINQCWLKGDVVTDAAGSPLSKGERTLSNVRWVLHDGIGYVFPAGTGVHLRNAAQSGRWSDSGTGSDQLETGDVFSLWLDHGQHPTNATYQYTVVPGTSPKALSARLKEDPIEVLSNTPEVQAVRNRKLGITQAVFWTAGRVGGLSVDQPCLVMLRPNGGRTQVSVANPENAPLTVNVIINGTAHRFDLPAGAEAGSSVMQTFPAGGK